MRIKRRRLLPRLRPADIQHSLQLLIDARRLRFDFAVLVAQLIEPTLGVLPLGGLGILGDDVVVKPRRLLQATRILNRPRLP